MGNAVEQLFGTLQQDATVESLTHEIAYYKAMLAEADRANTRSQSCLTPEMLLQRLSECEQLLARLQQGH